MAYKSVSYYGNWAQYRQGGGKFMPDQIDASLFTHICFAFGMLGFVSWSVDPAPGYKDGTLPDSWFEGANLQVNSAIASAKDEQLRFGTGGSPALAAFDDKLYCVH